jgi:hypothetical protein
MYGNRMSELRDQAFYNKENQKGRVIGPTTSHLELAFLLKMN